MKARCGLRKLLLVMAATMSTWTSNAFALPALQKPRREKLPDRSRLSATLDIQQHTIVNGNNNIVSLSNNNTDVEMATAAVQKQLDQKQQERFSTLIPLLGVVTGMAGVWCFRRFNCFLHMMTGCSFRVMGHLAEGAYGKAASDATSVLAYVTGAILFRGIQVRSLSLSASKQQQQLPLAVAASSGLCFLLSDIVSYATSWPTWCTGALLALGFGQINAYSTKILGVVTTAATGHLTRVGLAWGDVVFTGAADVSGPSRRFLAALLGSVLGTSLLCHRWSLWTSLHWLPQPPLGTTIALLYGMVLSWYAYGWRRGGQSAKLHL